MAKRTSNKINSAASARSALDDIDRVFHEKARLGIMTTIVGSSDGINFNELKELCDLTDGNLNRHLKVLVDTSVLSVRKTGQGRNTNSHYKLTAKGRKAFEKYLTALEAILNAAKKSADGPVSQASKRRTKRGDDGLSPAIS